MRAWFRVGLVGLIIVLGIRAYVFRPAGDATAPAATPGETAAAVLTDSLRSAERRSGDGMPWRVTQANSAHDVMVVDIDAERPGDARTIAEEVVAPLRETYQEVLIYVRGTGGASDGLVRRIQWTPDGGYVETSYSER